jgi:putative aldouronate transport system permease protein
MSASVSKITGRVALKRQPYPISRIALHGFLLSISLCFLAPLLLIVSASLTDDSSIVRDGYRFLPSVFSLEGYSYILRDPTQILRAYGVSVSVSVVGAMLSLLVMSLLGYALSRAEFRFRNVLSFLVFFTMLFNGGIVASYILNTRYLGLSDGFPVLVLPYLVVPFYVLLLRTYFSSLPNEILEAARIDGAGEWRIFFRIALPLSLPALATVGLLMLLLYWNDYFLGLLYLKSPEKYPLQLLMFNILNNISFLTSSQQASSQLGDVKVPTQSVRMAMAVLATGPMAFAFLLLQRYFVRGLTLGSVKG